MCIGSSGIASSGRRFLSGHHRRVPEQSKVVNVIRADYLFFSDSMEKVASDKAIITVLVPVERGTGGPMATAVDKKGGDAYAEASLKAFLEKLK